MSDQKECTKPPKRYDARQRAARALSSQGYPEALAGELEGEDLDALAELCSEAGELQPGVREGVQAWRAEYLESQKATDAADEPDEPTETDED